MKENTKKQFTGDLDYNGYRFKLWENHGKRRIYITNCTGRNKSNSGGYIDLDHNNAIHAVGCVKYAAERFLQEYDISTADREGNAPELAI